MEKLENDGKRLQYVLVLGAALLGCVLVNFTTTSSSFLVKLLLPSYLLLIPGPLFKDSRAYYLCLLAFLGSFGPLGIKKHFLHDFEFNLYTTIDLIDLLAVGLFSVGWLESKVRRTSQETSTPINITLLLFTALAFLSILPAQDKMFSLFENATLVRNILIFYVIADQVNTEDRLWKTVWVLMAAALAQSGLAILQEFYPGLMESKYFAIRGQGVYQQLEKIGLFRRVSGSFPAHNVFSFAYLDYLLPVLASFAFVVRSRVKKLLTLGIFSASMVALVFTLSRSGWLSLCVATTCFVLVGRRAGLFKPRNFLFFGVLLGVLCICLFFSWKIILSRIVSSDQGAAAIRLPLMRVAFAMISAHPWIGVGAGNYVYAMSNYDVSLEGVTSYFKLPVHNLYLYISGEMGVPALLSFLVFIGMVLKKGIETVKSKHERLSMLSLGVVSGMVGALFHGLTDYQPLGQIFMLWFMAGLLISMRRMIEEPFPARGDHGHP